MRRSRSCAEEEEEEGEEEEEEEETAEVRYGTPAVSFRVLLLELVVGDDDEDDEDDEEEEADDAADDDADDATLSENAACIFRILFFFFTQKTSCQRTVHRLSLSLSACTLPLYAFATPLCKRDIRPHATRLSSPVSFSPLFSPFFLRLPVFLFFLITWFL